MSTISICTLDTADSITSILNLKNIDTIVIDLNNILTKLDILVITDDETQSIVVSNEVSNKLII